MTNRASVLNANEATFEDTLSQFAGTTGSRRGLNEYPSLIEGANPQNTANDLVGMP